jgi:hypothetical protein
MLFMFNMKGAIRWLSAFARPTGSERAIASRLHEGCCIAVESSCVNAGDNSCDTIVWQNFSHDSSRDSQK